MIGFQGCRWRTRDHVSVLVEPARMTGTVEFLVVPLPIYRTAQVGTGSGHGLYFMFTGAYQHQVFATQIGKLFRNPHYLTVEDVMGARA